jgi:hypothetical protein
MTIATSHSFPEESELVERSTKGIEDSALLFVSRSSGFSSSDDPSELRVMKIQSLCKIRGYLRDAPGPGEDVPLSAVRCCVRDGSVSVYRRERDENSNHTSNSSRSSSSGSSPYRGCGDLETSFDESAAKWVRGHVERGRGSAESSRTQGDDGTPDMYSTSRKAQESGRKRDRPDDTTSRLTEGQRERAQEGDAGVYTISSLSVVVAGLIAEDILDFWTPLQALIAALRAKLLHLNKNDLDLER